MLFILFIIILFIAHLKFFTHKIKNQIVNNAKYCESE